MTIKLDKITYILLTCFAFAVMPKIRAQTAPDSGIKFVQILANDTLKFDVVEINVTAGQKVHVQLRNEGTLPKATMGHNWILLDSPSEVNAYAMAAMTDRVTEYRPKSLEVHVLASIPLLGPKETADITFTAPTKPGRYPYICSCCAHSLAGMKGFLIVKPSS
jgi:azurin